MAPKRPNFLIMMADDLGFSDLGCYGAEIKTPNLDRLADEGLRMSDYNHIAGLGVMHEHKGGADGSDMTLDFDIAALPEVLSDNGYWNCMVGKWHLGLRDDTIPSARGFHKSLSVLPGSCNHFGWEPAWDQVVQGQNFNPARVPRIYVKDGHKWMPEANITNSAEGWFSSTSYAQRMIEYFESRTEEEKEQPFFAYLAFSAPHWPLQCTAEDRDAYRGVYDAGPDALRETRLKQLIKAGIVQPNATAYPVVTNHPRWEDMDDATRKFSARSMEVYAGMVTSMDRAAGMVLRYLEKIGELDNTFVIFQSDNGAEGASKESKGVMDDFTMDINRYYDNSYENLGNHNSFCWYGPRWAAAATAPHRMYKGYCTEGGIRVPCVIRYPPLTQAAPGTVSHAFATCMDIMPTFLELAAARHPNPSPSHPRATAPYRDRRVFGMRGKSWVSYLSDRTPSSASSDHEMNAIHGYDDPAVGWEIYNRAGLRFGRWKINHMQSDTATGTGQWQLYDLSMDQGETNDLANEQPEKLAELIEKWKQYQEETGTVFGPALKYGQRHPLPDPLPIGTDYVMDNLAWIHLGVGKRLGDEARPSRALERRIRISNLEGLNTLLSSCLL
ncbi:hypothetical protein CLAIMM_09469 [Cladophialophora immunda]|nr:hypothetical protein CLAIMM_09469 [Cladophialophora immunda]